MTSADCGQAELAAGGADLARMWKGGLRRYLFPGLWLIYLIQPISAINDHRSGALRWVGYALVVLFAVTYLAALPGAWGALRSSWFRALYALAVALTIATYWFAHQDASVLLIFVAVLTVAAMGERATAICFGLALIALVLPKLVTDWNAGLDWANAVGLMLVSVAMLGFFTTIRTNIALTQARAEVARLAAENERTRIARDLHDLLGHSLTTITVKAGLARRLAETGDAERAFAEIGEVEALSRRTLGDVRAAVSGQREVRLASELATSREVLRASLITAELPGSVDVVDPALAEVFGWVLREAVTNIVRHSHAKHCRVELGPDWIEISDDGVGTSVGAGSGLTGLRERLESVGGRLRAGPVPGGWQLRADVPLNQHARVPA